jgi:hypothetical protein
VGDLAACADFDGVRNGGTAMAGATMPGAHGNVLSVHAVNARQPLPYVDADGAAAHFTISSILVYMFALFAATPTDTAPALRGRLGLPWFLAACSGATLVQACRRALAAPELLAHYVKSAKGGKAGARLALAHDLHRVVCSVVLQEMAVLLPTIAHASGVGVPDPDASTFVYVGAALGVAVLRDALDALRLLCRERGVQAAALSVKRRATPDELVAALVQHAGGDAANTKRTIVTAAAREMHAALATAQAIQAAAAASAPAAAAAAAAAAPPAMTTTPSVFASDPFAAWLQACAGAGVNVPRLRALISHRYRVIGPPDAAIDVAAARVNAAAVLGRDAVVAGTSSSAAAAAPRAHSASVRKHCQRSTRVSVPGAHAGDPMVAPPTAATTSGDAIDTQLAAGFAAEQAPVSETLHDAGGPTVESLMCVLRRMQDVDEEAIAALDAAHASLTRIRAEQPQLLQVVAGKQSTAGQIHSVLKGVLAIVVEARALVEKYIKSLKADAKDDGVPYAVIESLVGTRPAVAPVGTRGVERSRDAVRCAADACARLRVRVHRATAGGARRDDARDRAAYERAVRVGVRSDACVRACVRARARSRRSGAERRYERGARGMRAHGRRACSRR